ncbi:MAG: hypothetical protein JO339_31615, partial [Alphaproteobacteria bacterium]|nr:hypothetical protein [Alphaproteobacteria bacterium]
MDKYSDTARIALAHVHGGSDATGVSEAVRDTATDAQECDRDLELDEAMTRKALDLLGSRRNDRYEAALGALREDTRGWWADILTYEEDDLDEGETVYSADPDHLRRFIEKRVIPWFARRRTELANRP